MAFPSKSIAGSPEILEPSSQKCAANWSLRDLSGPAEAGSTTDLLGLGRHITCQLPASPAIVAPGWLLSELRSAAGILA
jgi:hypothetical protein